VSRRLLLVAGALVVALPAIAGAQGRRTAAPPRVEIGGGAGFAGGISLGERDASLRSNSTTPTPFRLFATDTRLDPSPRIEVRVGYRVTRRLTAEGTLTMARPTLTSSLSQDVENAAPVDATSRVTEYIIDAGALWRLSTNTRRRWTPFASGGAGVARQVHDGKTLIESGVDVYAGGALLYGLTSRAGLRLDGRAHFLSGGIAEGQSVSPRGAVSGSIFVAF
jgi:hypothetical protein